jgi:hypothetical protein
MSIRNYRPRQLTDNLSGCKVWEAARATSAAPSFFDPITIGSPGQRFADGAIGANNPVRYVLREATDVWPNVKTRLQCLLSIGTGHPGLKAFGHNLVSIGQSLRDLVTETTMTANSFAGENAAILNRQYFRFDVSHGLEKVGLEEHKKLGDIEAATVHYLDGPELTRCVTECVESLKGTVLNPSILKDHATDRRFKIVSLKYTADVFGAPANSEEGTYNLANLPYRQDGPTSKRIWACHGPHDIDLRFTLSGLPTGWYHATWHIAASATLMVSRTFVLAMSTTW